LDPIYKVYTRDEETEYYPHAGEKQKGLSKAYKEEMLDPICELFPDECKHWGDATACFEAQPNNSPDEPTSTIACILVLAFFATARFYQQSGQTLAAVMRKNKTGGKWSYKDYVVQQYMYGTPQVHMVRYCCTHTVDR
jgi:hypothetical protein